MVFDEFCPWNDDTLEIIEDLNKIKTWSSSINKTIWKLKIYISNPNCEKRDYAENKIKELEELKLYFDKYLETKYTTRTNNELKTLFNSIKLTKKLSTIKNEINSKIKNEEKLINDNWIFNESSYRDYIERNISFKWEYIHWTYNETKKMNEFLNIFTIEYINFTRKKKIKHSSLEKLVLEIDKKELNIILNNTKKYIKNEMNFNIQFKTNQWEEIINFNTKKYERKTIKHKSKKIEIKETNELIKKIKKYTNELMTNEVLLTHYNKKVVWSQLSRYKYIEKEFEKINIKSELIKEELVKLMPWLVAQESKYNNNSLNINSWAFSMFQFTDINFKEQIKKWILEKNNYLSDEENRLIKKLQKVQEIDINSKDYINLKKRFKLSMKKLTESAKLDIEYIYHKLNFIKNSNWEYKDELTLFWDIFKKVWLNNKNQKAKFISYMIINSYHSGTARIRILLKNFCEDYKWSKINNSLDLLKEITKYWFENKKWLLKGYDKESSEYVWRIISWVEAIKNLKKNNEDNLHKKKKKEKIDFKDSEKLMEEHWDLIPEKIKNNSKQFSENASKLLIKYIKDKKIIAWRRSKTTNKLYPLRYNWKAYWYCAQWVKNILKDSWDKNILDKNTQTGIKTMWAWQMNNYFNENSISISDYRKKINNNEKINKWYLKMKIDFPEDAYPGWIVVYKNKKAEPNLVWSPWRKKYWHVEIITRENIESPIYWNTKKIKSKEIHKNFRTFYDWYTIVTSWSTFNVLAKKHDNDLYRKNRQIALLNEAKKLRSKWTEEYKKITWFTWYVYYPIFIIKLKKSVN